MHDTIDADTRSDLRGLVVFTHGYLDNNCGFTGDSKFNFTHYLNYIGQIALST